MIHHTYDHYRRKTESDTAAAILTLAAVIANEADRMLTVKQAAELLQCSEDSIYQQCEAGSLPHKRIGRAIRIKESDLRKSE